MPLPVGTILTKEIIYNVLRLCRLEGIDIAKTDSHLNLQSTTLEAADQSFVRIQKLNLFNLLQIKLDHELIELT